MVWHGMVQYGTIWHGMARYGMMWQGMARYYLHFSTKLLVEIDSKIEKKYYENYSAISKSVLLAIAVRGLLV